MNHNLGPSNISTGTTYGNNEVLLVRPDGSREVFAGPRLPESALVALGNVATKRVGVNPPRISRIAAETPASRQSETDVPRYTAATDFHSPTRDSYAGPASRQMALDAAEAKNRLNPNRKTYQ